MTRRDTLAAAPSPLPSGPVLFLQNDGSGFENRAAPEYIIKIFGDFGMFPAVRHFGEKILFSRLPAGSSGNRFASFWFLSLLCFGMFQLCSLGISSASVSRAVPVVIRHHAGAPSEKSASEKVYRAAPSPVAALIAASRFDASHFLFLLRGGDNPCREPGWATAPAALRPEIPVELIGACGWMRRGGFPLLRCRPVLSAARPVRAGPLC